MSDTKQEPGCEYHVRKALEGIATRRCEKTQFDENGCADRIGEKFYCDPCAVRAALSAPCSCEQLREELTELKAQEALAWTEANGLDDKLSLLHDQLVQSQAEALNGKELLAGKVLTIQQLRSEITASRSLLEEARRVLANLVALPAFLQTKALIMAVLAKIEASRKTEVKP